MTAAFGERIMPSHPGYILHPFQAGRTEPALERHEPISSSSPCQRVANCDEPEG